MSFLDRLINRMIINEARRQIQHLPEEQLRAIDEILERIEKGE